MENFAYTIQEITNIIEKAAVLAAAQQPTVNYRPLEERLNSVLKDLPAKLTGKNTGKNIAYTVAAELARLARTQTVRLAPEHSHTTTHQLTQQLSLEQLIETLDIAPTETVEAWARGQNRSPEEVLNQLRQNLDYVETPKGFQPCTLWLAGRSVQEVAEEIESWPQHLKQPAAQRLEHYRPQQIPFEEIDVDLAHPCVPPEVSLEFFQSLCGKAWWSNYIRFEGGKFRASKFLNNKVELQAFTTPNCSVEALFNYAARRGRRPSVPPEEAELIDQRVEKLNQLFLEFLNKNPIFKELVYSSFTQRAGRFLAPPTSDAPLHCETPTNQLWPHQRRAARRIAAAPATLVFHPTGAGKTKTALAAAAALDARRRDRYVAYIGWSSEDQQRIVILDKRGLPLIETLKNLLENFFQGGTVLAPAIEKAKSLLADSRFHLADLLLITDGDLFDLDEAAQLIKPLTQNVRLHLVQIQCNNPELAALATNTVTLDPSELTEQTAAAVLKKIFQP